MPYTDIMALAILPALLFFASASFTVHLQAVKSGLTPSTESIGDPRSLGQVLWEGLTFLSAFAALIALMLYDYPPFRVSLWAMGALFAVDARICRQLDFDFMRRVAMGISEGARCVVTISTACAAAGIVAGTLGVTGLGSKIALLIETAPAGWLLLALLFTMVTSIILGMGLPTTEAYLIFATVVAPAVVKLGAPY
ncbi:MAG: TRAP transporter large permease subunit [Pseudomonadota bacterium]